MARIPFSLGQLARVVWGAVVPVASRTVTVTTNSDKTGYTLAASSPGVVKNIQRGTITLATSTLVNTFTLSPSVNSGKTRIHHLGTRAAADISASMAHTLATVDITGAGATAQAERGVGSAGQIIVQFQTVEEN